MPNCIEENTTEKKLKVLLIDTSQPDGYSIEYANRCRRFTDGTVIRKYYTSDENAIPVFYKLSEKMKPGYLRYGIRLIEYILSYFYVYKLVCKNHYDVVHITWPQVLWFDKFIFKKIRNKCKKLVYTAHDPIPHEATEGKIKKFEKLYKIPDIIIVHGKACVEQFTKSYPDLTDKIYNQKFGVTPFKKNKVNFALFEKHPKLKTIIDSNKYVFAFLGQISPYKGLDILLDSWDKLKDRNDVFLLVAGKTINNYKELDSFLEKVSTYDNVYVYNKRYDSEEEVLFHYLSDVIVLPFRSASMSGSLTSAAQYQKTVLTTKVGSITEYIESVTDYVFTCDCSKNSILEQISNIVSKQTKEDLIEKGKLFSKTIEEKYDWDIIYKDVINNCYSH